jgi:hypothetical protein
MLCCSFVGSVMKSHQAGYTTPSKGTYKISRSTQLCEILYTDSQAMLLPSSIVASCYCNCSTDGSTSPGNYGYPLILLFYIPHKHIFTKRKQLGLSLTKMHWLLGRKSQLSITNKLLLYKTILKPIWTYSGALLPPPTLKSWKDSNLRSCA